MGLLNSGTSGLALDRLGLGLHLLNQKAGPKDEVKEN